MKIVVHGASLLPYGKAEHLRGLEVDHELEFGRLHDRRVGGLSPPLGQGRKGSVEIAFSVGAHPLWAKNRLCGRRRDIRLDGIICKDRRIWRSATRSEERYSWTRRIRISRSRGALRS